MPFPRRSIDEGPANAAGDPHERGGRHPRGGSFSALAATLLRIPNHAARLRSDEEIPNRTLEANHPNFGSNNARTFKFGPSWIDAARTSGGSSRIGHHL